MASRFRSQITLLGVFFAAWLAWPLQTGRHFFSLIQSGEYERARRFLSHPDGKWLWTPVPGM